MVSLVWKIIIHSLVRIITLIRETTRQSLLLGQLDNHADKGTTLWRLWQWGQLNNHCDKGDYSTITLTRVTNSWSLWQRENFTITLIRGTTQQSLWQGDHLMTAPTRGTITLNWFTSGQGDSEVDSDKWGQLYDLRGTSWWSLWQGVQLDDHSDKGD